MFPQGSLAHMLYVAVNGADVLTDRSTVMTYSSKENGRQFKSFEMLVSAAASTPPQQYIDKLYRLSNYATLKTIPRNV